MAAINVNTANFHEEVLQAEGTVLVDFTAAWCGPCQMLSPVVDAFAEKNPQIKVCKLDIDESLPTALGYSVMSVPTVIVFKNGTEVSRAVGMQTEEMLAKLAE